MRQTRIEPRYVEFIPSTLEEGVLYISKPYSTAAHKCCCGCGTKIVTPLKPTDWTLRETRDGVSLTPSIGNWNHPCQSHYVIRQNRVVWAGRMSRMDIEEGRRRNQAAKDAYYSRPADPPSVSDKRSQNKGWLQRLLRWFTP